MNLLKSLPKTRANAIHIKDFAFHHNISPRAVRKMINDERNNPTTKGLILTSNAGVWFSHNPTEISDFYGRYMAENKRRMRTARNIGKVILHLNYTRKGMKKLTS